VHHKREKNFGNPRQKISPRILIIPRSSKFSRAEIIFRATKTQKEETRSFASVSISDNQLQ